MRKEVKIGILALVTLLGSIWGYTFLKGRNLLTNSYTFYSKFNNIEQLPVSAPVLISGVQVGAVNQTNLDPADMKTVLVEMTVEKQYAIPKNTVVRLVSLGLMGQKALELIISQPCEGAGCAESGDYLDSEVLTMMQSMLGEDTLDEVFTGVGTSIGSAFDTINQRLADPNNDGRITSILRNIDDLTLALYKTSKNLDQMIVSTNRNLSSMTGNMNSVLSNLKNNNQAIEDLLKNTAGLTGQLDSADLTGTINGMKSTMNSADVALSTMDVTLKKLGSTLTNFETITSDLKAGKGSLGKLMQDEELYSNLTKAAKNLDLLMEDFRHYPKRYIGSFWLGKKNKPYKGPPIDGESKSSKKLKD